jgi:hypothetical protein
MKKQADFYDWLKKHGVNVKIGKTPDRKRFFAELEDLRFSEKFTGYNSFNGFTSLSMDLQKSLEKLSEWLITKKDRLYFQYQLQ